MRCDDCGFRLDLWTEEDVERTLAQASFFASQVVFGRHVEPEVAALLAPLHADPADVHDVMHRLHLAGRLVHASTPRAEGVVEQISRSGGGVPKLAVPRADLDEHGVVGDAQADRRNHGRPWQALCLWSAEVVEEWAADGHPLGFGSAGENLTVRGLDWSGLTPGVRLLVGTALVQVTAYAIPCAKNAHWFTDGYFRRMAHDVSPGRSRLYASVLRPGTVAAGDPVVVEPVVVEP